MKILFKVVLLVGFSFLLPDHLLAQVLNQDQDGYSTLVFPGTNLGLDVSNNVANFSFYQARPAGWLNFWGLELKGKEKEGLVNLFSGGSPAIGAQGNLLLGHRGFWDKKVLLSPEQKVELDNLRKEEAEIDARLISSKTQGELLLKIIEQSSIPGVSDLHDLGQNVLFRTEPNKINSMLEVFKDSAIVRRLQDDMKYFSDPIWDVVEHFIAIIEKIRVDGFTRIIELYESIEDIEENNVLYISYKFFLRGGIEGSGFRVNANVPNSSDIDERFPKQSFTGWNAELGYNWQLNKQQSKHYDYIGFSYRLRYMTNMDDLDSHEFTIAQEDTTFIGGKLTTTTKVTALESTIDKFYRHSISFDYVRAIETNTQGSGQPSNLYLVINPYIRHHIYDNRSNLNHNTVLGFGLHAYSVKKQRIMGGLFVQTNDLLSADPLGQRISVGLIARFNFSGFDLAEPKS